MLELPVYLDYSATNSCDRRVIDVMFTRISQPVFGNAASRTDKTRFTKTEHI